MQFPLQLYFLSEETGSSYELQSEDFFGFPRSLTVSLAFARHTVIGASSSCFMAVYGFLARSVCMREIRGVEGWGDKKHIETIKHPAHSLHSPSIKSIYKSIKIH